MAPDRHNPRSWSETTGPEARGASKDDWGGRTLIEARICRVAWRKPSTRNTQQCKSKDSHRTTAWMYIRHASSTLPHPLRGWCVHSPAATKRLGDDQYVTENEAPQEPSMTQRQHRLLLLEGGVGVVE